MRMLHRNEMRKDVGGRQEEDQEQTIMVPFAHCQDLEGSVGTLLILRERHLHYTSTSTSLDDMFVR